MLFLLTIRLAGMGKMQSNSIPQSQRPSSNAF